MKNSTHTLPGEATVTVSGTERRILASKQGVDVSVLKLEAFYTERPIIHCRIPVLSCYFMDFCMPAL